MITIKTANNLLTQAEAITLGKWISHSQNVALAARRIAAACGLNADAAYVMGLLHNIGKRDGVITVRHNLTGYIYMRSMGEEDVARICLTHPYSLQDISVYGGYNDYSEDEKRTVIELLGAVTYTDYDRLIQLCDSLGLPNGFCAVETRVCDVLHRTGNRSEMFIANLFNKFKLKAYFEDTYGIDIYKAITLDGQEELIRLDMESHNTDA